MGTIDLSDGSTSGIGINSLATLLKRKFSLHLAAPSVRTLNQMWQKTALAVSEAIMKVPP